MAYVWKKTTAPAVCRKGNDFQLWFTYYAKDKQKAGKQITKSGYPTEEAAMADQIYVRYAYEFGRMSDFVTYKARHAANYIQLSTLIPDTDAWMAEQTLMDTSTQELMT